MDLQFPHHESEIAQSTICNKKLPARYWMHNNMITVNGKKMGKSYNNQIKLTEMFSGSHPLLNQAYSPMTIRFFILQTHYRSTLDFSNEALQAAEKGMKRMWKAFNALMNFKVDGEFEANNPELDKKVNDLLGELDEFIQDDLNTARVLANMFELVPVINSIEEKIITVDSLSSTSLNLLIEKFKIYWIDILGMKEEQKADASRLEAVLDLLLELRKDARSRKDYVTSDKIRNELSKAGIQLLDGKDGSMRYEIE